MLLTECENNAKKSLHKVILAHVEEVNPTIRTFRLDIPSPAGGIKVRNMMIFHFQKRIIHSRSNFDMVKALKMVSRIEWSLKTLRLSPLSGLTTSPTGAPAHYCPPPRQPTTPLEYTNSNNRKH